MVINWFEVFAQIFNFFILLALLNKFLFKPVMSAMEKREDEIANKIEKADKKLIDANQLIKEYEDKISDIKTKEEEIFSNAKKEAESKRDFLLEQYKEDIDKKRTNFEKEFINEQQSSINRFRSFLSDYTIKVSKKVLSVLSNTKLEDKTFEAFLKNIDEIPEEILKEERKLNKISIIIKSTEAINYDNQTIITEKIAEILKKDKANITIDFQTDSDLIYGYKGIFNTFNLNENLDFYLKDLEKEVLSQ